MMIYSITKSYHEFSRVTSRKRVKHCTKVYKEGRCKYEKSTLHGNGFWKLVYVTLVFHSTWNLWILIRNLLRGIWHHFVNPWLGLNHFVAVKKILNEYTKTRSIINVCLNYKHNRKHMKYACTFGKHTLEVTSLPDTFFREHFWQISFF